MIPMLRKERDPNAGRDEQLVSIDFIRLAQRIEKRRFPKLSSNRNRELVAAHAPRNVACSKQAPQTIGRRFE